MSVRKNLAQGLILSHLTYLLPLWEGASQSLVNKVQIVLNVAARWATGLGKRTRVHDLMQAAGWLSIKEQIMTTTTISTWKAVHLGKPPRLAHKLVIKEGMRLEIPPPILLFTRSRYKWRAVDQWNSLELDLRQEPSISRFKRIIKTLVLQNRRQMTST